VTEIRDEDWYGDDLADGCHQDVRFVDVDLTEVRTSGARFEDCAFDLCRFNASVKRQRSERAPRSAPVATTTAKPAERASSWARGRSSRG
jgi:hypothetical protein